MSGRKSSEVANVLAAGEKVRKHSNDVIFRQIEKDRESIIADSNTIEKLKKDVPRDVALSEETIKMMGKKAKDTFEQYQKLLKEIDNANIPMDDVSALINDLEKIKKCQSDADVEAGKIRRAITHKHDYCTPEYEQAQQLVKVYKECSDKQKQIQDEVMELAQNTRNILHEVQGKKNQLNTLTEQIAEMNDMAQKRMASDEQRNSLRQTSANINAKQAEKFLKDEFSQIKIQVENLINSADDVVLKEFSSVYGELKGFCVKLQEKYEKWLQEKKDAESLLKNIEELEDISYFNPIEYYNNGDQGEKEALFAYLKTYTGDVEYDNNAREKLEAAKNLLEAEKFADCMKVLQDAQNIVLQARDTALKLQENMLQKTELAGAIQDVMCELKYDTVLEPIDGNPNNGYRVTSKVGDEVIDFDKIDIDDDGNYIVNIDHKESRSGTCGSSWQNIVARMRSQGVPMTDVKKNGISVLARQQQNHMKLKPKSQVQQH